MKVQCSFINYYDIKAQKEQQRCTSIWFNAVLREVEILMKESTVVRSEVGALREGLGVLGGNEIMVGSSKV